MKRSQMLLEIMGQLQDFDSNYNKISYEEWKNKSEKVLKLIEAAGMLPPLIHLKHIHSEDCEIHDRGLKNPKCTCGGVTDNSWEEE